eukprot:4599691-Pyramimonas_sp.AAC.1
MERATVHFENFSVYCRQAQAANDVWDFFCQQRQELHVHETGDRKNQSNQSLRCFIFLSS